MSAPVPAVRIGVDGMDESVALERLAAIGARAGLDPDRRAAVDRYRLDPPLEQDDGDEQLFEAYRELARSWDVAQPVPYASHRPLLGPWIVRAKRLVARAIAFRVDPALERQARFNRAVLLLVGIVLEEIGSLRRRVRELEARDRAAP